jgi:hypothetical protein
MRCLLYSTEIDGGRAGLTEEGLRGGGGDTGDGYAA